jgi:hypothetical protein
MNGEYKKSKEMKNVQHKITKLNFGGYLTPYDKNKSDMRKRTSTQQPFLHNRSQGSQHNSTTSTTAQRAQHMAKNTVSCFSGSNFFRM